jgi:hypothetical protein
MLSMRSMCVFATLTLSAYATQAQRQANVIHDNADEIGTELQACLVQSNDFPEYSVLRRHAPERGMPPSMEQLTDRSTVTAAETQALYIAHARASQCRQHELQALMPVLPTVASILASAYAQREDNLIDLIQGKTTWGEYTRRQRDLDNDSRQRIIDEQQRIFAGLEQSREAELSRRQAAAASFSQYMQTQQMIETMNRPAITIPKVTTCSAYGNTANCITQ